MSHIRSGKLAMAVGAMALLSAFPASGATKAWSNNQAGVWTSSGNWSPGGAPGARDTALFDSTSGGGGIPYTVTLSTSRTVQRLLVGNDKLTFDLSGRDLSATSIAATSLMLGLSDGDRGRMYVSNGNLNSVTTVIGSSRGSTGSMTIDGSSTWNNSGSLTLGAAGAGNLTIAGQVNAGGIKVGSVANTKGTMLLSGAGASLNVTNGGRLGFAALSPSNSDGTGLLYIQGGASASFGQTLELFRGGTTRLDGGTLTAGMIKRNTGGQLAFRSGTINITKSDFLVGDLGPLGRTLDLRTQQVLHIVQNTSLNANAVLILNGGTLTTDQVNNSGQIQFKGQQSHLVAGMIHNGGRLDSTGPVDIQSELDNIDAGIVSLTGSTTTFHKGVVHNGSDFAVDGTSVATFDAPVSGAGDFSGGGLLQFMDSYSPGNSPAVVHIANDVSFAPEALLNLDLGGGSGEGPVTDQMLVSGTVDLGQVNLVVDPGFNPAVGQTFTLLSAGSIHYSTGNPLDSISLQGTPKLPYTLSASSTEISISFVPEPTTLASGIAIGTLVLLRRRRRTA